MFGHVDEMCEIRSWLLKEELGPFVSFFLRNRF